MFSKKEIKVLNNINPDEKFLESKQGVKAIQEGFEDASKDSRV